MKDNSGKLNALVLYAMSGRDIKKLLTYKEAECSARLLLQSIVHHHNNQATTNALQLCLSVWKPTAQHNHPTVPNWDLNPRQAVVSWQKGDVAWAMEDWRELNLHGGEMEERGYCKEPLPGLLHRLPSQTWNIKHVQQGGTAIFSLINVSSEELVLSLADYSGIPRSFSA